MADCYDNYDKSHFFPFPNRSFENVKTLDMILRHIPCETTVNILEIGSNRGDMLHMIKTERPHVNILGIEPMRDGLAVTVPTINGYFRRDIFSNKFDLIIMQHVLEHIKYPRTFIGDMRHVLSDNGRIYVEVPNLNHVLNYCLDDFVVEHVNYFDCETLKSMFASYAVIDSDNESFARAVFQISNNTAVNNNPNIEDQRRRFSQYKSNRERLINKILRLSNEGKSIVFYGVSFYFQVLMKELSGNIDLQRCFYYDDNYMEEYEKNFNLKRLRQFNGDCVVVICSNNFTVQDAIAAKIPKGGSFAVIKPWRASASPPPKLTAGAISQKT